jgi:hypothetical protein
MILQREENKGVKLTGMSARVREPWNVGDARLAGKSQSPRPLRKQMPKGCGTQLKSLPHPPCWSCLLLVRDSRPLKALCRLLAACEGDQQLTQRPSRPRHVHSTRVLLRDGRSAVPEARFDLKIGWILPKEDGAALLVVGSWLNS